MNMKISLLGYMGSGKTTVGEKLAEALQLEFIDLDQKIETNQNKSIVKIFTELGQIKFRKIEKQSLTEILERSNNFVLATGGGTPAYYNNIEQLNQHTDSIYLRTPIPELLQRLSQEKTNRPLLAHLNEEQLSEFVAKHLFERREFYEKAKNTVDTKNKSIQEITDEIIRLLLPT